MNKLKIDMEAEALIATFKRYGASITLKDIPQILSLGVDTFLLKKGLTVPDKYLSEFYLILNEIRDSK